MNEIRFHARRGQGAIEAARILASAFRLAGRDASWHIPRDWENAVNFEAGVVLSEEIREPSFTALAIFHPPLLEMPDIWVGCDRPDIVLINTRSFLEGENVSEDIGVAAVDGTGIARSVGIYCGLPGLVAPMLGAFAAVSGAVLGGHIIEALHEWARAQSMDLEELNKAMRGLELGYDAVCILRGRRALHCDEPEVERLLYAS